MSSQIRSGAFRAVEVGNAIAFLSLVAWAWFIQPQPSAAASGVASISRLTFGPNDVLFVADWKNAAIYAFRLGPAAKDPGLFNLTEFGAALQERFGQTTEIIDIAKRPNSTSVLVAVDPGNDEMPQIIEVSPNGKIADISLDHSIGSVAIDNAPTGNAEFWMRVPLKSFTVTDMLWFQGRLYVSGVSNQNFASTLRVFSWPFSSAMQVSLEIYHTTHDQMETRAPIRAMTIAEIDGVPTLVAAYMCTPLVTIPLGNLRDGAHVVGKTIAELGYGNTPIRLISFHQKSMGTPGPSVLILNRERSAQVVPITSIAKAVSGPGLTNTVAVGRTEGIDGIVDAPMTGIIAADNFDDDYLIVARRNAESGQAELVTIDKVAKLRLSDFVSEYNFPNFPLARVNEGQLRKMKQEGFDPHVNGQ